MRRYWVDEKLEVEIPFAIAGELFKHIHIVCRRDVGDRFELLSLGKLYLVEVKDIHKSVMVVDVLNQIEIPALKKPHIHLALSLPKIKTFEDVVEKSVELGVYSIYPFYSDFSFFKSKDRVQEKSNRLRKIVISACQQSARSEEMIIHPTKSFKEILSLLSKKKQEGLVHSYAFYEGKAKSLSEHFAEHVADDLNNKVSDIWIFIGSEGGFSVAEIAEFQKVQIPSLSIGEQVLRVETACVSIISVLKYQYKLF